MRCSTLCALALLTLAPSVGCNFGGPVPGVAMQDTFTLTFFGPPSDALNTPYVNGAKFDINVATSGYKSTTGWTLVSSNPAVIQVSPAGAPSSLDFPVTAAGTGHTTLSVLDANGKVLDSHDVDVDEPDTVQLHAHGLMMVGQSDAQTQVTHASVVKDGTATFLVRYFKGSQELWGNGAVKATGTGSIMATTAQSSFGDARDWIHVESMQAGSGEIALSVAGSVVASVPVDVVDPSQVVSVSLLAQSESDAKDGDYRYIFARAFDAQGGDVWGASYYWQANGSPVADSGSLLEPADVLSYQYESKQNESISATFGGNVSSVSVHGKGASLDSSADVACSVGRGVGAGGAGAGSGFALVLGAAGLVAARRRRSATAGRR